MTLGVAPRGNLRHVHDRIDARLHRRLCELGGRLNQAGPDRVDEVGAVHTFQGLSHDIEIEQIPDDNLCAPPPEALGTLVLAVHEGPNTPPLVEKLSGRRAAGRAGGTCDEKPYVGHPIDSLLLLSQLDVV